MQIVSFENNLRQMSKPIFWKNNIQKKKNKKKKKTTLDMYRQVVVCWEIKHYHLW